MKEVELIAQASEELERQGFVQEDFYLSEPLAKAFLKAQVCRRTNRDCCNVSSATEEDEKCVVSRLSSAKDMGVFTMRLQYSLENTLIQVKQLADNAKENKRQKHATILREILEMQDLKKEKNRLALYKFIFKLLLVEEEQEVDRIGERSIATALQSALAEDDIPSYERSSLDIRKQTIERLPFLVLGVRLYTQRDNAQFENSRDLCFEEFEALRKDLEQEISFEKKRMKNYKQVLDFEFCNPGSISSSIKELHDELTNRQQYFTYLLQLRDRTQKEFECVESLSEKYDRSMKKLTLTIGNQMSISKEQVFVLALDFISILLSLSPCFSRLENSGPHFAKASLSAKDNCRYLTICLSSKIISILPCANLTFSSLQNILLLLHYKLQYHKTTSRSCIIFLRSSWIKPKMSSLNGKRFVSRLVWTGTA